MFSGHRFPSDISTIRHIYSFLIEGNLDLIYQNGRGIPDFESIFPSTNSSLSIIRRINKASKEATKIWQNKIIELKRSLIITPAFKEFYKKNVAKFTGFSRTDFLVNDTMQPLLDRMTSTSTQPLISMLKDVFHECGQWEGHPDEVPESKDIITIGKLQLRQFYFHLIRLIRITLHDDKIDLPNLQNQFKFLLFERILSLLFKENMKQSFKQAIQEYKKNADIPHHAQAATDTCLAAKCGLLFCALPLLVSVILIDRLVPESNRTGRKLGLTITITFTILCTFLAFVLAVKQKIQLRMNSHSQHFRDNFLEITDERYKTLKEDDVTEAEDSLNDSKSTAFFVHSDSAVIDITSANEKKVTNPELNVEAQASLELVVHNPALSSDRLESACREQPIGLLSQSLSEAITKPMTHQAPMLDERCESVLENRFV